MPVHHLCGWPRRFLLSMMIRIYWNCCSTTWRNKDMKCGSSIIPGMPWLPAYPFSRISSSLMWWCPKSMGCPYARRSGVVRHSKRHTYTSCHHDLRHSSKMRLCAQEEMSISRSCPGYDPSVKRLQVIWDFDFPGLCGSTRHFMPCHLFQSLRDYKSRPTWVQTNSGNWLTDPNQLY